MPLTPTVKLTQAQIDFYHREGYLVVEQLSTHEEIEQLRDSYDRIFTQRAGRERGNQFDLAGTDEEGAEAALPQILAFAQYMPEFNDTLIVANAKAIARQLLGEDGQCAPAHAIYKPPHIGAPTPWHQDEAYWNPMMRYRSLSIWVPLQEATLANGCMHFVPRSHKLEILRHQSINNDPRVHGLELHPSEMHHVRDVAACPLEAGGCTIHDSRTLHYTPPNRSDVPRRACILGGSAPGEPRRIPRRYPWMEEKRTLRNERAKHYEETQKKEKDAALAGVGKSKAAEQFPGA